VPQKLAIDWTLPLTVERLMRLTGPLPRAELAARWKPSASPIWQGLRRRHLSGGEFQRALLARALARKPDLLVLDEPVQGVDFSGEVALYQLIRDIRDRTGCGILLISHDLHVVMADTDTVLCLNGHVCCRGTPESVVADPEYLRLFGARAAETLAIYRHRHDHTHLADGRVLHADGTITDHCHPDDGITTIMTIPTGPAMLDDFFSRALIAGIGLALTVGPLGCFIVWRRMAYFGDTMAHSALLGVAISFLFRIDLTIGVFAVAAMVSLALLALQKRGALSTDALLGILSHSTLALGLVMVAFMTWIRVDLMGFLFGDILAVSRADIAVIYAGGLVVLGLVAWLWRPLLASTVNEELAEAEGLRPSARGWSSCF
jgi:hypothetical protein